MRGLQTFWRGIDLELTLPTKDHPPIGARDVLLQTLSDALLDERAKWLPVAGIEYHCRRGFVLRCPVEVGHCVESFATVQRHLCGRLDDKIAELRQARGLSSSLDR